MRIDSQKVISVYYDGLCSLCSREINHYKKMNGAESIEFIDIFDEKFNASSEGLNPVDIHKKLHVKDQDGNIQTGVNAFICIWQNIPSLRVLAKLASFFPIKIFLIFLYKIFTYIRPLLPRKSCENSSFCEFNKS
ncbi:MAG: DUF393 domain-containing protein [Oligoflexia bacterium]|nr:DUF393 domain-containing protein [Oligoflexia bacterium]